MSQEAAHIARDWLFPQGASGALAAAIDQRLERDRACLARVAEVGDVVFSVLHDAVTARPDLWQHVAGAAGVRLAENAPPARQARVASSVAGMVAEIACAAGVDAVLPIGPTAMVSLPASRLVANGGEAVTLEVSKDTVSIHAGTTTTLIARTPGEVGLEAPGNPDHVQEAPEFAEFMVDTGGVTSVITLPPDFEFLGRPPNDAETTQLRQALAVLAHTNRELYEEMVAFPVRLALLGRGQHRLSLTATGLPDVIYTNLVDPLETVDLLVHEYHHLKLDLLAETTPLLARPRTPVIAPWRPDIRTADGVLHGAYVFANVAKAFDAIMSLGRPSSQGRRRRAAWRVAVQRAVELLRASDAEPTDAGHALLDGMELAARTWSEEHAQSDHHELEWARKEVERHVREVGLGTRPEPAYMIGVLDAHRDY